MRPIFISGIGTDVGKTIAAAVLAKAWEADYWKPIQAGELERSDSDKVREWCGGAVEVHPETFRLTRAMSPHAAALADAVRITMEELHPPKRDAPLLIEGAGGLLVPMNEAGDTMLDLAEQLDARIVLVSRNFLGSINQTLLSSEVLKARGVPVEGILFSGSANADSERIIQKLSPFPVLGRIEEGDPSPAFVEREAERFRDLSPFSPSR